MVIRGKEAQLRPGRPCHSCADGYGLAVGRVVASTGKGLRRTLRGQANLGVAPQVEDGVAVPLGPTEQQVTGGAVEAGSLRSDLVSGFVMPGREW